MQFAFPIFVQCYNSFWTVLGRFWLDMIHTGFFSVAVGNKALFLCFRTVLVAGFIFPLLPLNDVKLVWLFFLKL